MKDFKLGYCFSQDYNYHHSLSLKEFEYSFLHGVGYNLGVIRNIFL